MEVESAAPWVETSGKHLHADANTPAKNVGITRKNERKERAAEGEGEREKTTFLPSYQQRKDCSECFKEEFQSYNRSMFIHSSFKTEKREKFMLLFSTQSKNKSELWKSAVLSAAMCWSAARMGWDESRRKAIFCIIKYKWTSQWWIIDLVTANERTSLIYSRTGYYVRTIHVVPTAPMSLRQMRLLHVEIRV